MPIIFLTIILLIPQDVLAWGPATHLELGLKILKDFPSLPPQVGSLLGSYSFDFLYGNISADIIVGKNLAGKLKHCHNWKFGFKLLKKAKTPYEKAFAYGYLTHLAADTVAHNHFIPEMMLRSFSSPIRRHIYWEMRFDSLADKRVWQIPKRLVRHVRPGNDKLLSSTLENTPLSFKTSKTIFSSILSLQRAKKWRHMLNILSKSPKWVIDKEVKEKYSTLTLLSMTELLTSETNARCVLKDPIGKENLKFAKMWRKKLRKVRKSNDDWREEMYKALDAVASDKRF